MAPIVEKLTCYNTNVWVIPAIYEGLYQVESLSQEPLDLLIKRRRVIEPRPDQNGQLVGGRRRRRRRCRRRRCARNRRRRRAAESVDAGLEGFVVEDSVEIFGILD